MILVDDDVAVMERRAFEELLEYSCSLPTGVVIGKQWRRAEFAGGYYGAGEVVGWYLGEWVRTADPGYATVKWRRILILD